MNPQKSNNYLNNQAQENVIVFKLAGNKGVWPCLKLVNKMEGKMP